MDVESVYGNTLFTQRVDFFNAYWCVPFVVSSELTHPEPAAC